jgi:hypothetical protein
MLFFNYEEKKAKDHYSKRERSTTGLETNHWLNEYTVRGGGYAPFHRIIVSSISMLYVHEFRA